MPAYLLLIDWMLLRTAYETRQIELRTLSFSASTVSPFAILLGAGGIDDDGNATSPSTTASASGSAPYQNPAEGPIMLTIGIAGILSNVLCLAVLMKTQERKNAVRPPPLID